MRQVSSPYAVAQLRKFGVKARRLQYDLREWKAAGLPVESSMA
jgi:3-mercaptopyruvate sulfurtransferase SseA